MVTPVTCRRRNKGVTIDDDGDLGLAASQALGMRMQETWNEPTVGHRGWREVDINVNVGLCAHTQSLGARTPQCNEHTQHPQLGV